MSISDVTSGIWFVSALIIATAAFITTFRLLRGPNTLDRMISLDAFSAILQCSIGLYIAWTRETTTAPVLVALALISFIGSVAVARYRVPDDVGAVTSPRTLTERGDSA